MVSKAALMESDALLVELLAKQPVRCAAVFLHVVGSWGGFLLVQIVPKWGWNAAIWSIGGCKWSVLVGNVVSFGTVGGSDKTGRVMVV